MSDVLHLHTETPPPSRGLFPIDADQMNLSVSVTDELTPLEQEAIAQSNLALLPSDSPMRYLLEHRARPNLPAQKLASYDSGVCAASAVLRRHLRQLHEAGHHLEQPPFDPNSELEFAPSESNATPDRFVRIMMLPFRRQIRHIQDVYATYGRIGDYFEGNERIGLGGILRGFITGNIRIEGLPFLSDRQMESGAAPGFWQGVGDTFSLHKWLYEQVGLAGELSPAHLALTQDALPIFRSRMQDTWPEAGLTERQRFSTGADFYRQTHTAAGYVATMEKDGRTLRGNLWWNRHVPSGATIKKVRAFPSHGTLREAGQPTEHTDKITSRLLVKSARPGRRDTLLVRGAGGEVFPLTYPFMVPSEIADEDGTIELVQLCKFGETLDLMDIEGLDDEAQARCEELREEAIAAQEVSRWRRAVNYMLDGEVLVDIVQSSAVAPVGEFASVPIEELPPGAGSAGAFAVTFAGLRLWRRFRRNRFPEADQTPPVPQ